MKFPLAWFLHGENNFHPTFPHLEESSAFSVLFYARGKLEETISEKLRHKGVKKCRTVFVCVLQSCTKLYMHDFGVTIKFEPSFIRLSADIPPTFNRLSTDFQPSFSHFNGRKAKFWTCWLRNVKPGGSRCRVEIEGYSYLRITKYRFFRLRCSLIIAQNKRCQQHRKNESHSRVECRRSCYCYATTSAKRNSRHGPLLLLVALLSFC